MEKKLNFEACLSKSCEAHTAYITSRIDMLYLFKCFLPERQSTRKLGSLLVANIYFPSPFTYPLNFYVIRKRVVSNENFSSDGFQFFFHHLFFGLRVFSANIDLVCFAPVIEDRHRFHEQQQKLIFPLSGALELLSIFGTVIRLKVSRKERRRNLSIENFPLITFQKLFFCLCNARNCFLSPAFFFLAQIKVCFASFDIIVMIEQGLENFFLLFQQSEWVG
jgi:hypothetical protein